jgi:adenylate cyclase
MYVKTEGKNRSEATRSSERALELDSTCAESHASRGLAYLVSEQYDEAIEEFETAIGLNPNLFEPLYYYARASFHQGKLQKAADLFAKASEVNPEDYQSRILRSHVLAGLEQVDLSRKVAKEAIIVIENHLKWNPDDARAFYLGAGSLEQIGEHERAERWIGRALTIDPTDSVVLYNVGCFYALGGQVNKALNCLESAVLHGSISHSWMEHDNDLADLREDPRFLTLLENLQQANH